MHIPGEVEKRCSITLFSESSADIIFIPFGQSSSITKKSLLFTGHIFIALSIKLDGISDDPSIIDCINSIETSNSFAASSGRRLIYLKNSN